MKKYIKPELISVAINTQSLLMNSVVTLSSEDNILGDVTISTGDFVGGDADSRFNLWDDDEIDPLNF